MKIFMSEWGSGDRTGNSPERAIAWENGKGVEKAIEKARPNDEIVLQKATYRLTEPIRWKKSGRYSKPIRFTGEGSEAKGGEYGWSVQQVDNSWPTILGDRPARYSQSNAGAGGDFIRFQDGVENVLIEQLTIRNFARGFVAQGGHNEGVTIQSIRANNLRQFVAIAAKPGRNQSNSWHLSRCHITGVSKRAIRADGLRDASFVDIYADCEDIDGQLHSGDWPLLFHCEGDAHDIRFERCCGVNPKHPTGQYDNGDCFTTEAGTQHIRFNQCIAYAPSDAGFDLKGKQHQLHGCYVENAGNRAYRIWGTATLDRCMAERQGEARGDNAAIWVNDGSATVSRFAARNMQLPIAVDGSGSVRISDSRFELRRQLRDQGYSLRNRIKQNGSIRESNVKYQLI